jgi:hypothetical protein
MVDWRLPGSVRNALPIERYALAHAEKPTMSKQRYLNCVSDRDTVSLAAVPAHLFLHRLRGLLARSLSRG